MCYNVKNLFTNRHCCYLCINFI